jgi:hypothetical protein
VRTNLASDLHIDRLIAFSRDKVVEKSKEATEELAQLSQYGAVCQMFASGKLIFVSDDLREQIIDRGCLDSIVDNLAKPDHALFAADALLTFMKYGECSETSCRQF